MIYDILKLTCIAGFSVLIFGHTLRGDFVFDDSEAIVKNSDVVGSGPLMDLTKHDFWGSNITSNYSHKSYRPLTVYTFRLNYFFNGNALDAFQFKLINLLCHIICSILVWQAYGALVEEKNSWTDVRFLSALLFAVHPVHVEAVSGVVGRADLLAGILYFLAFITYVQATKSKTNMYRKYFYLAMNFLLAALSMLSKEIGVTVLGVCLAYEITYISRLNSFNYIYGENGKLTNRKTHEKSTANSDSIVRVLMLIIATIGLLAFRSIVMGNSKPTFQETDNPAAFSGHFFTRAFTYQYIYFVNVLLLVWPQWLCFDWSMGCVPLLESPFDPRILCVVLLYIYIIKSTIFLLNPYVACKHKRLLMMSYMMIFLPFLPASNILFAVGFVIAERLLYIPSAGFCLLVVVGLKKLTCRYKQCSQIFYTCYFLLVLSFGLKTWMRSYDWQTEHNLFLSGLQICPDNAKVHYNVAKVADARQQTEMAIYEYKEAIRLYPKYYQAMNNLANLLKDLKKFREAENYLREAIGHKPDFAAAWMNLAIVLANTKRRRESRSAYLTALTHRRNYPDCYYNLANLYLEMELKEEAEKSWMKAILLNPKHRLAWSNLLAFLDNTGQTQRALDLIPRALAELPKTYSIHFIIANILGKAGQFDEAEKHFLKAIELSGKNVQAIYYANLGVLYHRWKNYIKAEESYQKALAINPSLNSALDNIVTVRQIIRKQYKDINTNLRRNYFTSCLNFTSLAQ